MEKELIEITGVIMAGGKSSRFDFEKLKLEHHEKTLLKFGGKTLIERVMDAVLNVKSIKRVIVAISPHVPRTESFLISLGCPIEIIRTPGKGYHSDLRYIVKKLRLKRIITITADLPLIKPKYLEHIIDQYFSKNKPAMSVISHESLLIKEGIMGYNTIEMELEGKSCSLYPIGINLLDGNYINLPYIEQAIYLNEERDLLYNINTVDDYLKVMKKIEKEEGNIENKMFKNAAGR
ncbi:MAG: NTP transferase domain-containing protein [Promethearchaeota archaeon]